MTFRSIRFRLTCWYLAALSLSLALFGVSVWFVMRDQMVRNRMESIDRRLEALGLFLEREALADDIPAIVEEAREYSSGLPEGHGLVLRDAGGRVVFVKSSAETQLLVRRMDLTARGMKFESELSVPLDDYYRTLSALQWVLVGALPFTLFLAGGLGWWLAGRAFEPVDRLTEEARAISVHDLSARLALPGTGDELQRMAEAWNELLSRIDASVRAITAFTADAAHELRTPIAVIRTTSELALRQNRSPEQYRAILQSVHRETEGMTQLVEELLTLARSDAGQRQFQFDAVRFGDILQDLKQALEATARQRDIDLTWTIPDREPLVWADASALRRLLLNLVDNALKYTPSGGVVTVRLMSDCSSVAVEVEDNGIGIAPEHIPHVLERFYRADPARTPGNGTGLGLSIASMIAKIHNGEIKIDSTVSKGTLARFALPKLTPEAINSTDAIRVSSKRR